MPNETINQVASTQPWFWYNRMLWSVVVMFLLGAFARALTADEPFDRKKFTGELIISVIGAIIMYSLGLMQGMSETQIVCFGALASLGGLRSVEWMLKLNRKIRNIQDAGDNR